MRGSGGGLVDRCKLRCQMATTSVLYAIGCSAHIGTQLASAWETAGTLLCRKRLLVHVLYLAVSRGYTCLLFFSEPLGALQLPSKIHLYKVSHLSKPLKSSANAFTDAHQGVEEVSTGNISHSNYSTRRK